MGNDQDQARTGRPKPPRAARIVRDLRRLGDPGIAAHSQRFFKTGPGEYGAGDRFLGIRVPVLRARVPACRDLPLVETLTLLRSPWHEVRLLALLVLVGQYERGDRQAEIYRAYLGHTKYINNWDLVDSSAAHIVGAHLVARDRKPLFRLARSRNLWRRRIGIMATFHFVRRGDFADTLALAELLLTDVHDLIHKAVGWMLREIGKRDRSAEMRFLDRHYAAMPRTMLRYAIERLPADERLAYLQGTRR